MTVVYVTKMGNLQRAGDDLCQNTIKNCQNFNTM